MDSAMGSLELCLSRSASVVLLQVYEAGVFAGPGRFRTISGAQSGQSIEADDDTVLTDLMVWAIAAKDLFRHQLVVAHETTDAASIQSCTPRTWAVVHVQLKCMHCPRICTKLPNSLARNNSDTSGLHLHGQDISGLMKYQTSDDRRLVIMFQDHARNVRGPTESRA